MEAVSEVKIRGALKNCSKGEAKRLAVPRDLQQMPWEDLDFLGWTDQSGRGALVVPTEDGIVGLALRFEVAPPGRTQMCSICLTTHTQRGVSLMTARRAGEAGRAGNSVGTYMCTDLDCSLYARDRKRPALGNRYREDLTTEQRVQRVRDNVAAFTARVLGP
jgi:hypothetical protein